MRYFHFNIHFCTGRHSIRRPVLRSAYIANSGLPLCYLLKIAITDHACPFELRKNTVSFMQSSGVVIIVLMIINCLNHNFMTKHTQIGLLCVYPSKFIWTSVGQQLQQPNLVNMVKRNRLTRFYLQLYKNNLIESRTQRVELKVKRNFPNLYYTHVP